MTIFCSVPRARNRRARRAPSDGLCYCNIVEVENFEQLIWPGCSYHFGHCKGGHYGRGPHRPHSQQAAAPSPASGPHFGTLPRPVNSFIYKTISTPNICYCSRPRSPALFVIEERLLKETRRHWRKLRSIANEAGWLARYRIVSGC
jgi:hypothetical protein